MVQGSVLVCYEGCFKLLLGYMPGASLRQWYGPRLALPASTYLVLWIIHVHSMHPFPPGVISYGVHPDHLANTP